MYTWTKTSGQNGKWKHRAVLVPVSVLAVVKFLGKFPEEFLEIYMYRPNGVVFLGCGVNVQV